MSSHLHKKLATYKAGGAIAKGQAVKLSAADTVVVCAAVTDRAIGVANQAAASGEPLEVAMPGGGGSGKAASTIDIGNLVGFDSSGNLQKVDGASSIVIAQAMEAAVVGDIFSINVCGPFQATAAQS